MFLTPVFLNRELGKIGTGATFAVWRASGLIDIGVRCVVAAGWSVTRGGARTFIRPSSSRWLSKAPASGRSDFEAPRMLRSPSGYKHLGRLSGLRDPAFLLKLQGSPARDDTPCAPATNSSTGSSNARIEYRPPDAAQVLNNGKRRTKASSSSLGASRRDVPCTEDWTGQPQVAAALSTIRGLRREALLTMPVQPGCGPSATTRRGFQSPRRH